MPSRRSFLRRRVQGFPTAPAKMVSAIVAAMSKKRKFVADGVFFAELNEILTRELAEDGYSGVEVIVSGKLRAQCAKSIKFKDGYMISSGHPVNEYIDSTVRHVLLRQGVLGLKVKIMLDWDPMGKQGPTSPLPDLVTILTPKEEEEFFQPSFVAPEMEIA